MISPAYVMDSMVWVEFFLGDKRIHELVIDRLRKHEIIVPSICAYEVALSVEKRIGEEQVKVVVASMREQRIDELTFERSIAAASYRHERKLAMADAIVYATTMFYDATLITFDRDFEGLPNVHLLKPLT